MASDIFLKLGDIKGESEDAKHKGEIEIASYSWGVSQPGSMQSGGGGGVGRASFQDFHFVHNVDKASPNLLKLCATGEHVKDATLTVRKAGKGQQEYLIVKLNDVIVTSVQNGGQGTDGSQLTEQFSLQPAKIDFEYKPQKADGSLEGGIPFKYDVKQNKEG
jgi:type VI secretion system secreted protein Hcp